MGVDPDTCVDRALGARDSLRRDDSVSAYRVLNGQADGIPGLVIEKLGDVLIVQLHEGRLRLSLDETRSVVEGVHRRLGTRAVYRKTFVRDRAHVPAAIDGTHRDPMPWIGNPVEPELTVTEHDLRFVVRPYDGFSVGLFLEHRENRRRIHGLAAGRRVLNAFAYTCGFSVAAARGGAASVDSIDLSKRYLEWGKQNFTLNGIDTANPTPGKESQSSVLSSKETCSGPRHHQPGLPGHRFFCCDIFDFYKRASRQDRRYDLIILDPPTLSRTRRPKRVFVLEGQLGPLLAGAIDRIEPGGLILLATNHRQISRPRLEEELTTAARAQDRACTITERPTLPPDFAGDPDYAKSVIAHVD